MAFVHFWLSHEPNTGRLRINLSVPLESLAAGTPLVSVAAMGTKDVLVDNVGVRITDGSIEDFSDKVIGLLASEEDRQALAESGLAYVREWDATRLAEKMLEFYVDVEDFRGQHGSPQPS